MSPPISPSCSTDAGGGRSTSFAEAVAPEAPGWRPSDFAAVQDCLTSLARAVRLHRTYPDTSAMCRDAVTTCAAAIVALDSRDQLAFRVTSDHLIVDGVAIGGGGVIGQELAHRLHRAQVASIEISRTITARDLACFCRLLGGGGESPAVVEPFSDRLAGSGVGHLVAHPAHRPAIFAAGPLNGSTQRLVQHERQRRAELFAAGGPVHHLYPPDKGWIRVDPATRPDSLSLVDLAILIEDPAAVAVALMRLTGEEAEAAEDPRVALEHKFADVATIFGAVDPWLARLLFSKLSRAVLALEPDRRARLLRRTVLPGLLDGTFDGSVLADFPDVDLAEALCLLLDLETASPDVLATALDSLALPAERRNAIVPMLEARVNGEARAEPTAAAGHAHAIDTYARRLIAINPDRPRSFADFAAFDLAVGEQTHQAVHALATAIAETDPVAIELETRFHLVRLEANPVLVGAFMDRTGVLFARLEGQRRWEMLAQWASKFRRLGESIADTRPDSAAAIAGALERFCTIARVLAVAGLARAGGRSQLAADAFVEGFGATSTRSFLAALETPVTSVAARSLGALMEQHAGIFAPAIAGDARVARGPVGPVVARVLGAAGAPYTPALIDLLDLGDEAIGREALRALARVGSAQAAAAVALRIQSRLPWMRRAAEDALWQFPPAHVATQLRKLLAHRAFVTAHPDAAGRMLERAAQLGTSGLAPALASIAPLRFRFWNPALVRVAVKARELLRS